MHRFSIETIIEKIKRGETLNCTAEDGSFSLYISDYVPFVCAAIHNGSNLRKELRENCLLNKQERWYEEDPHTADFISSLPIKIIGNDSRYEYDLNRAEDNCVYESAWGKEIWKNPLNLEQRNASLTKHRNFYRVLDELIKKIETKYKACVVYDIHSYNFKRITDKKPPMFNIGTVNVNKKFRPFIDDWIKRLSLLKSDFFVNETEENLVFEGHGNFLKHITKKHKQTLVLATEVRKSYCDEDSGDTFPEVIDDIKEGMRKAILENAKVFIDKKANISVKKKHDLLTSNIEILAREIDLKLFNTLKDFDILSYVNPTNLESEKKKFFNSKFKKNPIFKYKPLIIDIPEFKRSLYELPVHKLNDITLQQIFKSIIEAYVDQVELLAYRGDVKFKYMSLKYFGEPNKFDLELAKYLLQSPDRSLEEEQLSSTEVVERLKVTIEEYGFSGKVKMDKNIPSLAVFMPSKKLLKVKSGMTFPITYTDGLCHHEIGVHMLTTENALAQPLKVLQIGLPINTLTQEGLAIASEYKAGALTIDRLKELALRVVAVSHMLKNDDFSETFNYLTTRYGVNEEKAFYLTARIYRGGGFTKDYLYLRGFRQIKTMIDEGIDISPLLVGKTSVEFLPHLKELIERGILEKPKYVTKSFNQASKEKDEVLEYLLSGFDTKLF
jgi:uncharacterized protein (TIGR02421 family)